MQAKAEEVDTCDCLILLIRFVLFLLLLRTLYCLFLLLVLVSHRLFLREVPDVRLAQTGEPGHEIRENGSNRGDEVCVYFLVKLEVLCLLRQVGSELRRDPLEILHVGVLYFLYFYLFDKLAGETRCRKVQHPTLVFQV